MAAYRTRVMPATDDAMRAWIWGPGTPWTLDPGSSALARARRRTAAPSGFLLWFSSVLSLPLVVHEAERHSVDEIVIEPGHPVTFHGEQGALVLGGKLDDATISDALALVLAPEQQAELAVAGIVEFYVEGYAEWSLVAESGADGVVVRGRLRSGATPDAVGMPLDLPPLEPFEPDSLSDAPQAPVSALRQTYTRSTRWDMNVAGSVLEPMPSTGSGALEDPTLPPHHAFGHRDTEHELPPHLGGSPLDDDDGVDFALVGRAPPTAELPEPPPEHAASLPRLVATRPTMRRDDTLAMHVDSLAPGTLVFLAGIGVGERLLEHLDEGFELVDLDSWDVATTRPFEELPSPGRGYLVRLEDPSRCLAWLLRRLEEGARVVVETRSRTAAGARRALLGAEATPHVVGWLDAHPQRWLHTNGHAWVLDRL